MFHSGFESVPLFSPYRPYIVLNSETWNWCRIKKFNDKFQAWKNGIPTKLDQLVLLQDCGAGADGRVWVACTLSGQLCAIKFAISNESDPRTALEAESKNWKLVNEEETAVVKLGGDWALVMPFVTTFPSSTVLRDLDQLTVEAIKEAACAAAQKGIFHEDLHPRHVARMSPFKKGMKPKIVFIDLVRVSKQDPSVALELYMKHLKLE